MRERWFVVHTQPRREEQAELQLRNQSFEVFLPRFIKSRRHARKFETVTAPLFPRYMFIGLNLGKDRWRSVNGTLGVDRLLMQNGKPAPVPYGLIEKLVESTGEDGVIRPALSVQAGERIQVTAGPFAEFVGELESLSDDGRVRVLLEIMGGYVPVTLSHKQVVATGPERQRPIYVSKRASVE